MRWPWISRKRHEWTLAVGRAVLSEALADERANHILTAESLRAELAEVRRSLIKAENEAAKLRGQLVAERHRQGLPASVEEATT